MTLGSADDVAFGWLEWGIHSRFREYVSSIPDGAEELRGATISASGGLAFALAESAAPLSAQTTRGVVEFRGGVRFRGYRGALFVTISDPWLELDGVGGVLSVDTSSTGVPFRQPVAQLRRASDSATDPTGTIRFTTALTDEGVALLGNVYAVGSPADDVSAHPGTT